MSNETNEPLDDLLARMPDIAKAVSAFPEAVQQSAFDALMAAASGSATPAPAQAPAGGSSSSSPKRSGTAGRRKGSATDGGNGKTRGAPATPPKVIKELDLRPKGKTSLADFVDQKKPKSDHDRRVVALYYLTNVAGISPVTFDHVFTAWREMGWKLPHDFRESMRLTSSKKRFFDTSNGDDLRLYNPGVNRVEQDLPPKPKS